MPYVGNQPAANFASVTKDAFSGDGSETEFTLSKAATTNGVAVFVENVRQEPTIAYSVSGTTLTFTAAPVSASGNNIYVLHHNAPASTANHPAGQDLTAVNGTMTGTLAVTGTSTLTGATTVGGTSNLTIADGDLVVGTSGHGIDFSATSDASGKSSELLDDYEEGTWTAGISTDSGSVTLNSSQDLCSYTKIGNMVTAIGRIGVSSVSSPSGAANLTGLPFTSSNSIGELAARSGGAVMHDTLTGIAAHSVVVYQTGENLTTVNLFEQNQNGVANLGGHLQASSLLVFSITYPAA